MSSFRITETNGEDWVAINLFKDCDSLPFVVFRSFPNESPDAFKERVKEKVLDMSNGQIDLNNVESN